MSVYISKIQFKIVTSWKRMFFYLNLLNTAIPPIR